MGEDFGTTVYVPKVEGEDVPENYFDMAAWEGGVFTRIPVLLLNNSTENAEVFLTGSSWWWSEGDQIFLLFDTTPAITGEQYLLDPGGVAELGFLAAGFLLDNFEPVEATEGDSLRLLGFGIEFTVNGETQWAELSSADDFLFSVVVGDNRGGEPVPEPATMLLMGTGLVGMAGLRRRKK